MSQRALSWCVLDLSTEHMSQWACEAGWRSKEEQWSKFEKPNGDGKPKLQIAPFVMVKESMTQILSSLQNLYCIVEVQSAACRVCCMWSPTTSPMELSCWGRVSRHPPPFHHPMLSILAQEERVCAHYLGFAEVSHTL